MITGLRLVHPGKGETLPPLLLLLELLALPELLELLEPLAPPVPPVPPRPAVPELLLEPVSPPVRYQVMLEPTGRSSAWRELASMSRCASKATSHSGCRPKRILASAER